MVSDRTKKILNHVGLFAVLILMSVLISQSVGLGRTGFDSTEVLTQFFFYAGPGAVFLLTILALYLTDIATNAGDSTYGNSVSFASPDEPPALLGSRFQNPIKLLIISAIIFMFLGLYTVYSNTYFTGVGTLKQQFTVLDSILFSSFLVPASENAGPAFLFALFLFFFRKYAKKKELGRANFIIVSIFAAVVLFAGYGWFNHLLRYGGSDLAISNVVVFWAVGGLITALSGSFIPFWIMHICNNLFFDLHKNFSNDAIYVYTFVGILLLAFSYFLLFMRRKKQVG